MPLLKCGLDGAALMGMLTLAMAVCEAVVNWLAQLWFKLKF